MAQYHINLKKMTKKITHGSLRLGGVNPQGEAIGFPIFRAISPTLTIQ